MITVGQCLSEESSIRDIILYHDVLFEVATRDAEIVLGKYMSEALNGIVRMIFDEFKETFPKTKIAFAKFKSEAEECQKEHVDEAAKEIKDSIEKFGWEKGLVGGYMVFTEEVLVPTLMEKWKLGIKGGFGLAAVLAFLAPVLPAIIKTLTKLAKKVVKSIKSAAVQVKKAYQERRAKKLGKKSKEDDKEDED